MPEARVERYEGPVAPRFVPVPYASRWNRVVVLANRAPVHHSIAADGAIVPSRSGGGLVTALEPIVRACAGTWVAHGAGPADRLVVDASDGVDVPPANSPYRLRYVWSTREEHQGHYFGFSNEGLWPLCHGLHVPAVFRPGDFASYAAVNERFAAAALEEAGGSRPLVLVQDYHLALAPRFLRERLPLSTVVSFWHIPWPDVPSLKSCAWHTQLLDGLLAGDIVGVQTEDDRARFLQCVAATLDARVDVADGIVEYRRRRTLVRAYPVGIEWNGQTVRDTPPADVCRAQVLRQLDLPEGTTMVLGVDRLDYTKGIHEKLLAFERLLTLRPDLRGRIVFVQIAEPSRDSLPAYRRERSRIRDAAARINAAYANGGILPVRLLEAHHSPAEVYRLYRACDACFVGSLRDGMNLVAKEFVAAREDERGTLVLSLFAGAARSLEGAILVNPNDIEETARLLARAIDMPALEARTRMRTMRRQVAARDASWWTGALLSDARELPGVKGRVVPFPAAAIVPS